MVPTILVRQMDVWIDIWVVGSNENIANSNLKGSILKLELSLEIFVQSSKTAVAKLTLIKLQYKYTDRPFNSIAHIKKTVTTQVQKVDTRVAQSQYPHYPDKSQIYNFRSQN